MLATIVCVSEWVETLLARLKNVLKIYRAQHPSADIKEGISLFSATAHRDLTSRPNEKWDFLGLPWLFSGPIFGTETNTYNGISTAYRVYAVPFAIPRAYQRQGFKPSLAVFVKLAQTVGVSSPSMSAASP
jgi:hypothetical protein